MSTWTSDELDGIGDTTELRLAAERDDGALWPDVTIWSSALTMRSTFGQQAVRIARGIGTPGRAVPAASAPAALNAGVTFSEAPGDALEAIDSACHSKYDRYGQSIVGHVFGPKAHDVSLRLVPEAAAPSVISE